MSRLILGFALALFLCGSTGEARPTFAKNGLVVSGSDLASQAGAKILQSGGNAADAAAATYFVLSVVRPYYGSLGGGGFMLVRFNNKIDTIDYRERAPGKSTEDMFVKKPKDASQKGGLASGTPGNVRGFYELHKKFGHMPWIRVLKPAIDLAHNGFPVTEELARLLREKFPDFNAAGKSYFGKNGRPLEVGDILKQPQLARALELIARNGADGFYKGAVAEDVVQTADLEGGILTADDLARYHTNWRAPLKARVYGVDLYTMPPPSSGGALVIAELKLSQMLKAADEKPYSENQYHLMAEIMSRAFFDRQYLADPDYTTVPADEIYRDERLQKWTQTIDKKKKSAFDPAKFELGPATGQGNEKRNTTHFVVADKNGNCVSSTVTINDNFGSDVVTQKFGITLNNEMDDFTTRPGEPNLFGLVQGKANAVAPYKTPLSSMTPTIIEKDGKFLMGVGSPGGPRIINAVYQVVFHALTTSFNLDEIIQAPRVHHQFKPDKIFYDRMLAPDIVSGLEKRGHTLTEGVIARVYGIRLDDDGLLEGAFDSRAEGGAAGY